MFKNKEDAKSLERFFVSYKEVMEMYEVMENSGMKKYENAIDRFARANVFADNNEEYVYSGNARKDLNALENLLQSYKKAINTLANDESVCVLRYKDITCPRECYKCWKEYLENE